MNAPNLLQQLSLEMAGLVNHVRHRLVQISDGMTGVGAGTIWHSDGLIITNAHVATHDGLYITLSNGELLPSRVIARDVRNDLAALVVEANNLPTIEIGDSQKLEPGQWVMAIGHPLGEIAAPTAGIVIGHENSIDNREWLAVSLRLRPGHSGGALVDNHGQLIGINTLMTGPEVGMAIPVHVAKRFLQESLTL